MGNLTDDTKKIKTTAEEVSWDEKIKSLLQKKYGKPQTSKRQSNKQSDSPPSSSQK